ncbi:MAG: diguanylate cyclase [Patescibacteria group bacterium]|nr:diguanylate cyclase [Patescibacteria group bacterium]
MLQEQNIPIKNMEKNSDTVENYIFKRLENLELPTHDAKNAISERLNGYNNEISGNLTKERKGIIDDVIMRYKKDYIDSRDIFTNNDVKNQNFARHRIIELIKNGNENFTRVFIDIEGLKTVNDIVSHRKGDVYLSEIYKKMQKTVREFYNIYPALKDEISITITAESGDEFGFLIEGKKDGGTRVSQKDFSLTGADNKKSKMDLGNLIVNLFNDNLSDIDCDKFITKKNIIDSIKKDSTQKEFEEYNKEYKDYKFFTSASAGVSNMENMDLEKFQKNYIKYIEIEGYSKEEAERKAKFDVVWEEADRLMYCEKDNFKKQLINSGDITGWENLIKHIKILSRNEEQRKSIKKVVELERKNKELKDEIERLKKEIKNSKK